MHPYYTSWLICFARGPVMQTAASASVWHHGLMLSTLPSLSGPPTRTRMDSIHLRIDPRSFRIRLMLFFMSNCLSAEVARAVRSSVSWWRCISFGRRKLITKTSRHITTTWHAIWTSHFFFRGCRTSSKRSRSSNLLDYWRVDTQWLRKKL